MPTQDRCSVTGCPHKGEWAIRARIPAKGWSLDLHRPLSILVGMPLCRDHASEQNLLATFPDLREVVVRILDGAGYAAPDFERAWVEAIRRTDPEYLEFERQQAGRPQ